MPFIIVNTADLTLVNINSSEVGMYTPFILGNTDGVNHVHLPGNKKLGFEDIRD